MKIYISCYFKVKTYNNGAEGSRNCLYINVSKAFVPHLFRD